MNIIAEILRHAGRLVLGIYALGAACMFCLVMYANLRNFDASTWTSLPSALILATVLAIFWPFVVYAMWKLTYHGQ